ncbi:MAG: HU family DNA-binding protein [bacterium]
MTKADIIDIIAKGTGLTKVETGAVIDGFLASVSYALQNGDKVELRGFGTFALHERKKKVTQNPKTGKIMEIPHRVVPSFKPSKKFKDSVMNTMQQSGKFVSDESESQIDIFSDLDKYL